MPRILVDTSVWISHFKQSNAELVSLLAPPENKRPPNGGRLFLNSPRPLAGEGLGERVLIPQSPVGY